MLKTAPAIDIKTDGTSGCESDQCLFRIRLGSEAKRAINPMRIRPPRKTHICPVIRGFSTSSYAKTGVLFRMVIIGLIRNAIARPINRAIKIRIIKFPAGIGCGNLKRKCSLRSKLKSSVNAGQIIVFL